MTKGVDANIFPESVIKTRYGIKPLIYKRDLFLQKQFLVLGLIFQSVPGFPACSYSRLY